jgi:hypothetical protein
MSAGVYRGRSAFAQPRPSTPVSPMLLRVTAGVNWGSQPDTPSPCKAEASDFQTTKPKVTGSNPVGRAQLEPRIPLNHADTGNSEVVAPQPRIWRYENPCLPGPSRNHRALLRMRAGFRPPGRGRALDAGTIQLAVPQPLLAERLRCPWSSIAGCDVADSKRPGFKPRFQSRRRSRRPVGKCRSTRAALASRPTK